MVSLLTMITLLGTEMETEMVSNMSSNERIIGWIKEFFVKCKASINYIAFPVLICFLLGLIFWVYQYIKGRKFKKKFIDIGKKSKDEIATTEEEIKKLYKKSSFEDEELLCRLDYINSQSNLFTELRPVIESVYLSIIVAEMAIDKLPEDEKIDFVILVVAISIIFHIVLEEVFTYTSNSKERYLYGYEKEILIEKLKSNSKDSLGQNPGRRGRRIIGRRLDQRRGRRGRRER